jgi:hypothetical protein
VKQKRKNYFAGLLVIFTALAMSSCGGNKKIVYQGDPPDRTSIELLSALEDRNIDFDWFVSKAGAKIESPEENAKGTVYLRVKKDSMIWLVFKKYSVEASRMLITQDSFFIIYRLDKKYERGSIEDLEQAFNIDFSFKDAQQLIVGNSFLPDTSQLDITMEPPYYKMDGEDLDFLLTYWINGFDLSLEKLNYRDNRGREVNIKYGDYRIIEGKGRIPYLREYDVPADDGQRAYFKLDFKEIGFEKPERTIFRIPEQYMEVK